MKTIIKFCYFFYFLIWPRSTWRSLGYSQPDKPRSWLSYILRTGDSRRVTITRSYMYNPVVCMCDAASLYFQLDHYIQQVPTYKFFELFSKQSRIFFPGRSQLSSGFFCRIRYHTRARTPGLLLCSVRRLAEAKTNWPSSAPSVCEQTGCFILVTDELDQEELFRQI